MQTIKYTFFAILLGLLPCHAIACNIDGPPPSMDELTEAETVFTQSDSALQKMAAYTTMLQTGDTNLRNVVLNMGFETSDKNIRAAALRCRFLTSTSLKVEALPFEDASAEMPNMTEKAQQLVAEATNFSYSFFYVDAAQTCASINFHHDDECKPNLMATSSALTLTFKNDRGQHGRFVLNDENRLIGELNIWNGSGYDTIPSEAFLN